jgi:hypothetical protein
MRKVDAIHSEGQREVSRIYEAFSEHQELRIFLDKLEALEEVLKERTTLIFDTNVSPIEQFDADKRLESLVAPSETDIPSPKDVRPAAGE